ncbi:microtubule-associated protein futsch isoform X2 [Euwallacea fornicatus]|uniref:microtubule-associated protein futsch isoform X2 n=1 Tax=Euwallacea fornicatus TaxID=995702 RepID=UPI00338DAFE6
MPSAEVTRSDSNRSDASQRPRVSFNRDVHVKRIVPRENTKASGVVTGINGDTVLTSPIRKQRVKRSKKELAEEAAKVIRQADNVGCVASDRGAIPDKFFTLPSRKKSKEAATDYPSTSLDRRALKRRGSNELQPPKKPPRTFATTPNQNATSKSSIFDIFHKPSTKPKKSNLRRSISDASSLRSKAFGPVDSNSRVQYRPESDGEECTRKVTSSKKQLSPIIEVTQREDYFAPNKESPQQIIQPSTPIGQDQQESVTEQLKNYIDEVDEELYRETGIRITSSASKKGPQPIIIDVDKAQNVSSQKKHKLKFGFGKKLKSLTHKKLKSSETKENRKNDITNNLPEALVDSEKSDSEVIVKELQPKETKFVSPAIQCVIEEIQINKSPEMIHSSQKPAEKLPLTKGKTVNNIVKRLSSDSCSSPPPTRTNVLIMPNISVQHNNNQPFSYTRGISPDKHRSNEDLPRDFTKPVIYAQVVCGAKDNEKQTVHKAYNGRRQPHSDSDEGLGGEDSSGFNTRKYDSEKQFTQFGDEQFESYQSETEKLIDEIDKYKAESPIMPKYRSPAQLNGFSSSYNGIMERGRGDGMDAKRRESLTEPDNINGDNGLGRSDLSARRDLLESRINRRITDKNSPSPEYCPPSRPPRKNVLVTEKSSRYYRGGSTSPVGYKEKYVSETKKDVFGESHFETRTKKFFGDPRDSPSGFKYELSDNEPKSFDYQPSDYRSSPENQRFDSSHSRCRYVQEKPNLIKDKSIYRSTPEIHQRAQPFGSSFHGSLPREDRFESGNAQRFRSERFLNREESDRRTDRLVDSGIENDFRRDSTENYKVHARTPRHRDLYNESEDEGFASSLLIANEKNHTSENIFRKSRRDYDSDINSRDEFYRNNRSKYVPRERSIDDGSHFDPRLDKDIDRTVIKVSEKKPPKPEKKSGLEKMKALFTRDKKKDKSGTTQKTKANSLRNGQASTDYKNRRRLSTPSPVRDVPKRSESTHGSWFKSLDRLTKKRSEKRHKDGNITSTEDEITVGTRSKLSSSASNLRFFGDTDQESNGDSVRGITGPKKRSGLRSQSTRDLHNIAEEKRKVTSVLGRKAEYKSLNNISETHRSDLKGSRTSLKPPISPNSRYNHEAKHRDDRRRRNKRPDLSSVESSTEGDSSQQSQRSIVYLHAATVGDIPGPEYLRTSSRAISREDLTSNGSSLIQPQVKTLSRSFSVLAPWKPRNQRDALDIDYTQYNKGSKNGKYEQRTPRNTSSRNESSTLKRKAQESRRNNYQQSLNRKSRSKENLARQSKEEVSRGSTSTLFKKKDKLPRENSRYLNQKEERRMPTKSHSVESIARKSRNEGRDVSRSISMPRDTEKTAGWFKKSKK